VGRCQYESGLRPAPAWCSSDLNHTHFLCRNYNTFLCRIRARRRVKLQSSASKHFSTSMCALCTATKGARILPPRRRVPGAARARLSSSCSSACTKKCTACAFSSTRKDRRPKKCTTPPIMCSIACHELGGAGGPSAPPKAPPANAETRGCKRRDGAGVGKRGAARAAVPAWSAGRQRGCSAAKLGWRCCQH